MSRPCKWDGMANVLQLRGREVEKYRWRCVKPGWWSWRNDDYRLVAERGPSSLWYWIVIRTQFPNTQVVGTSRTWKLADAKHDAKRCMENHKAGRR